MGAYLTVDFGSTFTKATAIDTDNGNIIATSKSFTTIETDVTEGLDSALNELYKLTGKIQFEKKLACSSAGGGLKMISVGLVPDLTVKTAKMSASSAGAKVIKTYSYELDSYDLKEIYEINPDIILLCGGTDGGNRDVIIHNADMLSTIDRNFSIIVAGNKSANEKISQILTKANKDFKVCLNVMPTLNKINTVSAKNSIRDLFIEKIILAKGLDKAQQLMSCEIIPTPLSVLIACELLSKGYLNEHGLGDFMAIDIGGATTDVYSMSDGKASNSLVILKGIPEPFAKRSVEGDLGLRYSLKSLLESATIERVCTDLNLPIETILNFIDISTKNPEKTYDTNTKEKLLEEKFAALAVEISMDRHCGYSEVVFTSLGEATVQHGKDLRDITKLIGIGGPIINATNPSKILESGLYSLANHNILKPTCPKLYLDKKYIFASMGLLSKINPSLALSIMKKEVLEI
jgi:uncharacterized protein (TIGR01319 family)